MIKISTLESILLAAGFLLMSMDSRAMLVFHPQAMAQHQHNNRRPLKIFQLTGFENSRVTLITPDLNRHELETHNGQIKFTPTGMDNYHALLAQRVHAGVQEAAIRYVYSFGKPSGQSPAQLTQLAKTDLEIIPDPLPREHWHYKAGHEAAFLVRFKGHPLASMSVSLFTNHASLLEATTDTQGRVLFNLPDDFPNTQVGNDARPAAEMMLTVRHSDNDQHYASWLSAEYRANPEHWRNTQLGVLIATGGFLFGAWMTRLGYRSDKTNRA